jgi:F0F1-type ATP synthase assembly protein I
MQSNPWLDSQTEQAEQDTNFVALDRRQAQALQARLGSVCLPCAFWVQGFLAALVVLLVGILGCGAACRLSVLLGVLLAWLPQSLLVFGVGRRIGQMAAPEWLLQLFIWEALKWVLTLVLMALVVVWIRDVSWLALLLAFVFTLKVGWGVLFVQHVRRGASAGESFKVNGNE